MLDFYPVHNNDIGMIKADSLFLIRIVSMPAVAAFSQIKQQFSEIAHKYDFEETKTRL